MATLYPPTTRAAATVLGYLLEPFSGDCRHDQPQYQPIPGLPNAVSVPGQDALIVVTGEAAPHGRVAIQLAAADRHLDIALLRMAHDEEGAVTVAIDLMLASLPHAPWSFDDLSVWTGPSGDVWLVPGVFGPSIELTTKGFVLDLLSPYSTAAERATGILRAAAEIACLLVSEAR